MDWTVTMSLAQLAATMAMLGAIWVVQLCVYPRFLELPPDKFVAAHFKHCMGIGVVVAPLMVTELIAAIYLVCHDWGGTWQWGALILTGGTWLSTAVIQAPCHLSLMSGFDAARCRALTLGNWVRTAMWTIKAILVFVLLLQVEVWL